MADYEDREDDVCDQVSSPDGAKDSARETGESSLQLLEGGGREEEEKNSDPVGYKRDPFDPNNPDITHPDFRGWGIVCHNCKTALQVDPNNTPGWTMDEFNRLVIEKPLNCTRCQAPLVVVAFETHEEAPKIQEVSGSQLKDLERKGVFQLPHSGKSPRRH